MFAQIANFLIDTVTDSHGRPLSFAETRRLVRWHYQWLVIHDFLPRIVGEATASAVYKERAGQAPDQRDHAHGNRPVPLPHEVERVDRDERAHA